MIIDNDSCTNVASSNFGYKVEPEYIYACYKPYKL
jgi:hypothetical protein